MKNGMVVKAGKLTGTIESIVNGHAVLADSGDFAGTMEADRIIPLAALVEVKYDSGWCNRCHSYCYGDCEANGADADNFVDNTPWQKGDDRPL